MLKLLYSLLIIDFPFLLTSYFFSLFKNIAMKTHYMNTFICD